MQRLHRLFSGFVVSQMRSMILEFVHRMDAAHCRHAFTDNRWAEGYSSIAD